MEAKINWKGNLSFDGGADSGFSLLLGANPAVGGDNDGFRPMELIAIGLAGCTGMDVISILKKMRVGPDYFNVEVVGEMTEEHPKYYHKIHLIYTFKGSDLPMEKLEKAVSLSQERYCGVTAMLGKAAEITHEIRVNP